MTKLKAAMLQSHVYSDKAENIRALCVNLEELAKEKPDLVTLPEMFNCPYQSSNFPVYAEKEGEETWQALSSLAAKYGIYLSAGSVPETDEQGHIFNTAYVFDRNGNRSQSTGKCICSI